jgi:hypothetical protein
MSKKLFCLKIHMHIEADDMNDAFGMVGAYCDVVAGMSPEEQDDPTAFLWPAEFRLITDMSMTPLERH